VALKIVVPVMEVPALPAGVAERYSGTYRTWWRSESNVGEVRVTGVNGKVTGTWTGAPFPVWTNLTLVPFAENWFHPGAMVDGCLYDVVTDLVFEFEVVNGRATGFDLRGPNDNVVGHGTRID
jgi:hypothetical protein